MPQPTLDHNQLCEALRQLGVRPGGILLVHGSLSSIGHVEGGPDTVIEALLEVLTPEGTLLVPTHHQRDGSPFDVENTPSALGLISETFRRRPGVIRSRHPFHPVAACGPKAAEMLRDHHRSPIPDGLDTPYGRLIAQRGQVLLLGCDLNTLTLLHAIEAELDLPYLGRQTHSYLDEHGRVQTVQLERCPGGYRRNACAFDRPFCNEGAMRVGKAGRAVCRLIEAEPAAQIMRRELARDPAFVLGDHPHCADTQRSQGKIKQARLAREDFQLCASLPLADVRNSRRLLMLEAQGICQIEIDLPEATPPDDELGRLGREIHESGFGVAGLAVRWGDASRGGAIAEAARALDTSRVRIIPPAEDDAGRLDGFIDALNTAVDALTAAGLEVALTTAQHSIAASLDVLQQILSRTEASRLGVAYDPAGVATAGQAPFRSGPRRNSGLRGRIRQVQITDVAGDPHRPIKPGRGISEVRQLVSHLRCRSFDGLFCLVPVGGLPWEDGFRQSAAGFWEILDDV